MTAAPLAFAFGLITSRVIARPSLCPYPTSGTVSTWAWAMTCAAAQTMRIKASGIEGLIVGMYLSSENVRQTSVCRLLPDATDCEAGDKLKFVGHRFQYWRRTRPGAGRG